MEASHGVLTAIYDRFLLRDVFGKMVPGAVAIGLVVYPHVNVLDLLAGGLGFGGWLVLLGVSWAAALALQGLGEALRLFRFYPRFLEKDTWEAQLRADPNLVALNGGELEGRGDRKAAEARWLSCLRDFARVATPKESLQKERYVVLREAAGNCQLVALFALIKLPLDQSLGLSTALIPIPTIPPFISILLSLSGLTALFLGFLAMHRIYTDRHLRFMLLVLQREAGINRSQ